MTEKLNYYDFGPLLSYNAPWSMATGARGTGKTFGAKRHVLNRFIRKGEQFLYLRRHRGEGAAFRTFMNDIAYLYPDYDFYIDGKTLRVEDGTKNGALVGQSVILSQARQLKSKNFKDVYTVIFDEFILEKNGLVHYLPLEADIFEGLYSTIDRWNDRTRVIFIANAASITNPYFVKYGIVPSHTFETYHDGFIVVHTSDDSVFADQVAKTRFGRFLTSAGGQSADYMMKSTFIDNNVALVAKKPPNADYAVTIVVRDGQFSLWIAPDASGWYCQRRQPRRVVRITPDLTMVDTGVAYCGPRDGFLAQARALYGQGRMFFDEPQTRNLFIQIFKGV